MFMEFISVKQSGFGRLDHLVTQPMHFYCYQSFVQSLCSHFQQPSILNKVQYFAASDVFKVIWFHKMLTWVPKL
jgi:hypothetical protein